MSHPNPTAGSKAVLAQAMAIAGIETAELTMIRDGSNALYRLGNDVIARVGRAGTAEDAARELEVSSWLNASGIPTVESVPNLPQPIVVGDCPVTWWRLIPEHRHATFTELGAMLRALHELPIPIKPALPQHDPFAGLRGRIARASTIDGENRTWLLQHHDQLERAYSAAPAPHPPHVIHGDAWQGNLVVPQVSRIPTVLDLDKVSIGCREWDLIQIAVDHNDFRRVPYDDYQSFVNAYGGYDIIAASPRYRLLADIQELRWVAFALDRAGTNDTALRQANLRIACIRGSVPKPWSWDAL